MRIDDDQDAVWLRVRVAGNGASCHLGYRSCFYRSADRGSCALHCVEAARTFDPRVVYGDAPNPTLL